MDARRAALIRKLQKKPEDSRAFKALRAHYASLADYASEANLLEGWGKHHTRGEIAAMAALDGAEIAARRLGDPVRAGELVDLAMRRAPNHEIILNRAETVLRSLGDGRRLYELLSQRAQVAKTTLQPGAALAAINFRAGEAAELLLKDYELALTWYRNAFGIDASYKPALQGARRLYSRTGNLRAQVKLLAMEARAEPALSRRVALWLEVSNLCEHLGDRRAAVDACEHALADAPARFEVRAQLVQLLFSPDSQGFVLAFEEGRRAVSERLAAEVLEQLDGAAALATAQHIITVHPRFVPALRTLQQLGEPTFETALSRALKGGVPADEPALLALVRDAGLLALSAGREQAALTWLEPLLAVEDTDAARALASLYTRWHDSDGQFRALRVLVKHAHSYPPEQMLPWVEAFFVLAGELGYRDEAVSAAAVLFAHRPGHVQALALLESVTTDPRALAQLFYKAALAPGIATDRKQHLLRRLLADPSQLSAEEVAQVDAAAFVELPKLEGVFERMWGRALQRGAPEVLADLLDGALAASLEPSRIQAALVAATARLKRHPEVRHWLALALDRALATLGLGTELLKCALEVDLAHGDIESALAHLDDLRLVVPPSELRAIDWQRLELFETHSRDLSAAFDVARTLFVDAPQDEKSLLALRRLGAAAGLEAMTAHIIEDVLATAETTAAQQSVASSEIARRWRNHLRQVLLDVYAGLDGEPSRRLGHWIDWLEESAGVAEPLSRFPELLAALDAHPALLERLDTTLRARLERGPIEAGLARAFAEVGEVRGLPASERLARWRPLLDEGDRHALERIADLAQALEDWAVSDAALARLARLIPESSTAQFDVRLLNAAIALDRQGDAARARAIALPLADDALLAEPQALALFDLLARACCQLEDRVGEREALRRWLEVCDKSAPRLEPLRRLVDLEAALQVPVGERIAALENLAQLAPDPALLATLDATLQASGKRRERLPWLSEQLRLTGDPAGRRELTLKLATLRRELGDAEGAFELLVDAQAHYDPEITAALEVLAKHLRRRPQLVGHLRRLADESDRAAERADIWRHIAAIEALDTAAAFDAWAQVYREQAGAPDAALALRRLVESKRDSALLADAAALFCEQAQEPEQRRAVALDQAALLHKWGRFAEALEVVLPWVMKEGFDGISGEKAAVYAKALGDAGRLLPALKRWLHHPGATPVSPETRPKQRVSTDPDVHLADLAEAPTRARIMDSGASAARSPSPRDPELTSAGHGDLDLTAFDLDELELEDAGVSGQAGLGDAGPHASNGSLPPALPALSLRVARALQGMRILLNAERTGASAQCFLLDVLRMVAEAPAGQARAQAFTALETGLLAAAEGVERRDWDAEALRHLLLACAQQMLEDVSASFDIKEMLVIQMSQWLYGWYDEDAERALAPILAWVRNGRPSANLLDAAEKLAREAPLAELYARTLEQRARETLELAEGVFLYRRLSAWSAEVLADANLSVAAFQAWLSLEPESVPAWDGLIAARFEQREPHATASTLRQALARRVDGATRLRWQRLLIGVLLPLGEAETETQDLLVEYLAARPNDDEARRLLTGLTHRTGRALESLVPPPPYEASVAQDEGPPLSLSGNGELGDAELLSVDELGAELVEDAETLHGELVAGTARHVSRAGTGGDARGSRSGREGSSRPPARVPMFKAGSDETRVDTAMIDSSQPMGALASVDPTLPERACPPPLKPSIMRSDSEATSEPNEGFEVLTDDTDPGNAASVEVTGPMTDDLPPVPTTIDVPAHPARGLVERVSACRQRKRVRGKPKGAEDPRGATLEEIAEDNED